MYADFFLICHSVLFYNHRSCNVQDIYWLNAIFNPSEIV